MKAQLKHVLTATLFMAATACGDSGDAESEDSTDTGDTEESTSESTDTTTETTETTETTDTTESDTTESDTTESETTESDTTESDTTESDTTESDTTESDTTETGLECMGNDGLTMETAGASCLEILDNGCSTGDGSYWVMPGDVAFEANCDMTTDGGGWTELSLPHLCNGDLNAVVTGVEPASEEGVDANCRPFTADGPDDHTYTLDVPFAPTFEAFYLSGYAMRANGNDASGIIGAVFTQSDWNDAHGNSVQGDVSFGSADEAGPVMSFASENPNVNCTGCVTNFANNDMAYTLGAPSATFRIGWGEAGSEDEGWYPWWSGSIYLR